MGRPKGVVAKIAEELDVDPKTVRRAFEASGIGSQQAENDFDSAVEIVRSFIDNERVVGHQATRITLNPSMANSRRRLEDLKARQLEIEIQKAEGGLVERSAVIDSIQALFGEARTAALTLGVRLAPKLTGLSEPKEVAKAIESEVRLIFETLASDLKLLDLCEDEALM